jgi:hypothetical protein
MPKELASQHQQAESVKLLRMTGQSAVTRILQASARPCYEWVDPAAPLWNEERPDSMAHVEAFEGA